MHRQIGRQEDRQTGKVDIYRYRNTDTSKKVDIGRYTGRHIDSSR